MKIVGASSMPFVREAFQTLGDVVVLGGRSIGHNDLVDAQLLAIRSTTCVTPALLQDTPVQFVGLATIGTDHMDIPFMDQSGIHWCYAPGCNANSVAEYVVSALLCLSVRHDIPLAGHTLGIVGVGNVGARVAAKAAALGLTVLLNDPPRQRNEPENAHCFVSLDTLLEQSDIVTMHVPLTRDGEDATFHMADRRFFDRIKNGCIFINAARGAVVYTEASGDALQHDRVAHAVIDTWENEPSIPVKLLNAVDLATPHIAGYSLEGKVMGTVMVYHEACRSLGVEPTWAHAPCMPEPIVPAIDIHQEPKQGFEHTLWNVVRHIYDIERDDSALRSLPATTPPAVAEHFDDLRINYPVRREFRYTRVTAPHTSPTLTAALTGLEFQLQ